jgi:hypothetical protein
VHLCFKVELPRILYYRIFPNSRTLMILLQIDPVFSDEPKIVHKGFMKLKTPPSLHGFQFPTLDTMLVIKSNSSIAS